MDKLNSFYRIKYLVVDVDGTLTDSGIYYDNNSNELKKFSTRDAAGFFAVKEMGIKTIILTGRESKATLKRMTELKVDFIFQNVKNKYDFLKKFMEDNRISKNEIGYIGDDLNDLAPMSLTGFIGCPADSCQEIKNIAHNISVLNGGQGAFRDIIEKELRKLGVWNEIIHKIFNSGV
jgi:3-deoxy-D-manno-octulosonate 8-phosphate phosphatase (KDO 8-P phosphatase)